MDKVESAASTVHQLLGALGFCICLLKPHAVFAEIQSCADLPPTTVSVKLLETDIQKNYQRGIATLKGMSNRYADPKTQVLGLTLGKAVATTRISGKLLRDNSGQWECASYQVSVELGYQPITIYVGKEFPEGSCAFNEVYNHEMRHAQTYQEHARTIIPEIEQVLQQRFGGNAPVRGTRGISQERMQKELQERWLPYIRRMLEQAETLQREIDTREEYERVSNACNGQIRQLTSRLRA